MNRSLEEHKETADGRNQGPGSQAHHECPKSGEHFLAPEASAELKRCREEGGGREAGGQAQSGILDPKPQEP